MKKILLINGPNLNMLGTREKSIYGDITLGELENELNSIATTHNIMLTCLQTNTEGQMIEYIQQALNQYEFIILNPAAFTHTSIAVRDALLAVAIPFIEVHLSNIFAREPFRHKSFFSDIAVGTISGFGKHGYICALNYAIHELKNR